MSEATPAWLDRIICGDARRHGRRAGRVGAAGRHVAAVQRRQGLHRPQRRPEPGRVRRPAERGVAGVLPGAGAGRPAVHQRRQHRPQAVPVAGQPDRRAVAHERRRPGCIAGTSSGTRGQSAGVSTAWGSFGRSTNPTLRDVHEYITVWSKDQLRLDGGGETGISGNQFVAWTRSVWRPEELLGGAAEEDRRQAGRRPPPRQG